MTGALVSVVLQVLDLYKWVVIAAVIASWLINFNVINSHNQFVRMVVTTLYALTEPVFRAVRRVIPAFGGLDLSPIVVLLLIFFLSEWIFRAFVLGQPF